MCLWWGEALNFNVVNISFIYSLLCPLKKKSMPPQDHKDILLCYVLEVFHFIFTFKPVIYMESIFVVDQEAFFPYEYSICSILSIKKIVFYIPLGSASFVINIYTFVDHWDIGLALNLYINLGMINIITILKFQSMNWVGPSISLGLFLFFSKYFVFFL